MQSAFIGPDFWLLGLALLLIAVWAWLLTKRGQFWRPYFLPTLPAPLHWPSITIIIPARNEGDVLPTSLASWFAQDYPGSWQIIVVDDRSQDNTATLLQKLSAQHPDELRVIATTEPPPGWSGKVAAMQAGLNTTQSDYVLFTDADIVHPPQQLRRLVSQAIGWHSPLVSLIVKLHCQQWHEKLLIPAFIFFFQLLYPFRWVNDDRRTTAAAAGGTMLVERATLAQAGGLAAIKDKLIDDCSLAALIKPMLSPQRRTVVLANSEDTFSIRPYSTWRDIVQMIVRTADEQLHHQLPRTIVSCFALALGLASLPILLAIGLYNHHGWLVLAALLGWGLQMLSYWPTIALYRLPPLWTASLPLASIFFMVGTLLSAWQYRTGGNQWKGRAYRLPPAHD